MAESSRSSWGDIVKAAEEHPRPIPAASPHLSDAELYRVASIPAPDVYPPAAPAYGAAAAPTTGAAFPSPETSTYGVPPSMVTPFPANSGPSPLVKALSIAGSLVALAGLGYVGYWGYGAFLQNKDTHTEASAPSTSAPDPSAGGGTPGAEAPAPAPAPAPDSGAAGSSAGDEGLYLSLLRNKPEMIITNPDRLLTLGKEVCVYLSTQRGVPLATIINVREMLLQEGVTSDDGREIALAAVNSLCPQYKSKIIPG
jgi:hypothetical protein